MLAARLIGYDKDDILYIIAEQIGVGSADLSAASIKELNTDAYKPAHIKAPRHVVAGLAAYVEERRMFGMLWKPYSCSGEIEGEGNAVQA